MKSITSSRLITTKHVVQRTCVVCHQKKAKRELVRLLRTPEGNIEIDITGKKEGRGAYLCRTRECWETALKGNQLGHSLRIGLTPSNHAQLIKHGKDLLKGAN